MIPIFRALRALFVSGVLFVQGASSAAPSGPEVLNPGFEAVNGGTKFAESWQASIGGGAKAEVRLDNQVAHSGSNSVYIHNQSPLQAFVFGSVSSSRVEVTPSTTYILRCWVKAKQAKMCYASASYEGAGDTRKVYPSGDYDWREIVFQFTTPESCKGMLIRFASDDVTEGLWIDDVSLEVSPRQLANLPERQYPKPFAGVFPRSRGPLPERLVVFDNARCSDEDVNRLVASLQGLVNRRAPRLYVINHTNPPYYDETWLKYMQDKGYTGPAERLATLEAVIARFRDEIEGVIAVDPELPGSYHAACMLGGLKKALPGTPALIDRLKLPVIMDLRGKWTRNVDAYRYVYDQYWDQMNHHVLAWLHPTKTLTTSCDYMTEFNVFRFWVSGPSDNEKGADPDAEEEFVNELFANTPANVPVMGWPACGDSLGVQEYTGVRWMSEYGKFVPGTEFTSNASLISAIEPDSGVFKQKCLAKPSGVKLDPKKTYITLNVIDSGDAVWYFQFWQRKIWSDPLRGTLPIGWCMNVTIRDMLPLVAQWYFENATENDTFFAAISGLGYMNTQVYANRFRAEDRARIWTEYVKTTDEYCRALDLHGIEIYNGSWGEMTPPTPETFARFVDGMRGLDYILADLGRHDNITPDKANYFVGDTAVFHTLTRFQVWSSSAETVRDNMDKDNAWLFDEIRKNTPASKPGFMSGMGISWYYFPTWFADMKNRLGDDYVVVTPGDLARLSREAAGAAGKPVPAAR